MKDIKNVLICGIGAIGSIYASRLQNYDKEHLRVLVDEKRLERYIKSPVLFNGHALCFNYVLPTETDFKADLIIIATKFSGLAEAAENIKNFVKEDTIILKFCERGYNYSFAFERCYK